MRAWQSWGEKVDLKIKIKHLLDYVKLSGMMESEHGADILFSPESGTKRKPVFFFFLSAIFWGAMLVFSLLRKGSDVYVWPKKSLSTPGSCGEHSCHDWRPSHGRTTAEEEWQQMTTTT